MLSRLSLLLRACWRYSLECTNAIDLLCREQASYEHYRRVMQFIPKRDFVEREHDRTYCKQVHPQPCNQCFSCHFCRCVGWAGWAG